MARRSSLRRLLLVLVAFAAGLAIAWALFAPQGAAPWATPHTPQHLKPLMPALRKLQDQGMPSTAPKATPSLGTEKVRDQLQASQPGRWHGPAGPQGGGGWKRAKGWQGRPEAQAPGVSAPVDGQPQIDVTRGDINGQLEQMRERLQRSMDRREGAIERRVNRNLRGK